MNFDLLTPRAKKLIQDALEEKMDRTERGSPDWNLMGDLTDLVERSRAGDPET